MPIFFQQEIDEDTKLAVWKIEEDESFFNVPLQREITHPHKRLQHLSGRYLLRYLFPHFPLNLIQIADTRKPFLKDEAYHFSISHCGDFAAAIVSRTKRVGVDIEIPTPKVERIKHKFLHPDELTFCQRVHTEKETHHDIAYQETLDNQLYPVTLLWSAKEAVFKWWSYGGVDFSNMIRLQPTLLNSSGSFDALFCSPEKNIPLLIHYRFFKGLCLAWVVA